MLNDYTKPKSSFEAAGKDLNSIMMKVLGNQNLMKLLKYNTSDALSQPNLTKDEIKTLMNTNVRIVPKLPAPEEMGSYIIILFDNFQGNDNNPVYRDNFITIDVICHVDNWLMDDYMLRPYKIMHELDKMLHGSKLNGIGNVQFVNANTLLLNGVLAGYTLAYKVINDA